MKTREVTSLALKIFAMFLLMQAFFGVPMIYGTFLVGEFRPEGATSAWLVSVSAAVLMVTFVLAIALWKLANRSLIESLKNESDSKALEIVPSEFELIVFSVFGLYLVVGALSALLNSLAAAYVGANQDLSFGIELSDSVFIVSNLGELLVGASLVVYPRKWSELFSLARKG